MLHCWLPKSWQLGLLYNWVVDAYEDLYDETEQLCPSTLHDRINAAIWYKPLISYLQATIDFGALIHSNEYCHHVRSQCSILIPVPDHNIRNDSSTDRGLLSRSSSPLQNLKPVRVQPNSARIQPKSARWPGTLTASSFKWLHQYANGPGHREAVYCYTPLAVSSLVVATPISSTYFCLPWMDDQVELALVAGWMPRWYTDPSQYEPGSMLSIGVINKRQCLVTVKTERKHKTKMTSEGCTGLVANADISVQWCASDIS